MVREVDFVSRDYASLTEGASAFLFVTHTTVTAKKTASQGKSLVQHIEVKCSPLNAIVLATIYVNYRAITLFSPW